jgi:succinylglutamate desuccinylase
MLTITDTLPARFFDIQANQLHEILNGPTLIHLPGALSPPLFVSVLLHGNEETGFLAIQKFLQDYQEEELPRSLSLFIGNIAAAKEHVRKLENQPDYNRIWPGCVPGDIAEEKMMQQVFDDMSSRRVFASIDIHNTSGHNPHYACINHLEHSFMQLGILFGRSVVYFTRPKGVQTMAFAALCPAVTLECGQVTDHDAVNHAVSFLKKIIKLDEIPPENVAEEDIDLFHTTAIVKVPQETSFSFMEKEQPIEEAKMMLNFVSHLDEYNFREIPEGTIVGHLTANPEHDLLNVQNVHDEQVFHRYFSIDGNELRTSKQLMPSMLSTSEKAVQLDCLCYLMERIKTDGALY